MRMHIHAALGALMLLAVAAPRPAAAQIAVQPIVGASPDLSVEVVPLVESCYYDFLARRHCQWETATEVVPGGTFLYGITVRNVGQVATMEPNRDPLYISRPANNVTVELQLPVGARTASSFVGGFTEGFACTESRQTATCTGGTIPTNGSVYFSIQAVAPSVAGPHSATVRVDPANLVAERNETNNTATATVSIRKADLTVSVERDWMHLSAEYDALEQIHYPIRVWNADGVTATGVVVRLTMPIGSTFDGFHADPRSYSSGLRGFTCSGAYAVVTCSGGTLAAGESADLVIDSTLPRSSGTLSVVAEVDPVRTVPEQNESNNSDTYSFLVHGADLGVLSLGHSIVPFLEVIRSLEVYNHGPFGTDARVWIDGLINDTVGGQFTGGQTYDTVWLSAGVPLVQAPSGWSCTWGTSPLNVTRPAGQTSVHGDRVLCTGHLDSGERAVFHTHWRMGLAFPPAGTTRSTVVYAEATSFVDHYTANDRKTESW